MIQPIPSAKRGSGTCLSARMARVSAPPISAASVPKSRRRSQPIHSVVAAASLASPPPIQPMANMPKVAASTADPQARWTAKSPGDKPANSANGRKTRTNAMEMRLEIVIVNRSDRAA